MHALLLTHYKSLRGSQSGFVHYAERTPLSAPDDTWNRRWRSQDAIVRLKAVILRHSRAVFAQRIPRGQRPGLLG